MTPDTGAFIAEARDWLAAHVPPGPLPSVDTAEGFARHRDWERELAAARLAVVSWPERYGGRDASLLKWLVFEEEYHAARAPVRVGQNGLFLLAPTLFAHGRSTPAWTGSSFPPGPSSSAGRAGFGRALGSGSSRRRKGQQCAPADRHRARPRLATCRRTH